MIKYCSPGSSTKRALVLLFVLACSSAPPGPEPIPPGAACGGCRMAISNPRLAAQIVATGEEPIFFDDLGCLRAYEKRPSAIAYVADYQTGVWLDASTASYFRCDSIETPMSSHLIAVAPGQTLTNCETLVRGEGKP
ncbi:MAG TPA: hypothetical protein VIL97_00700 [Thermoanaerobaculia bacterium]